MLTNLHFIDIWKLWWTYKNFWLPLVKAKQKKNPKKFLINSPLII